jgi:glycosyltransferase involved in cell wall biosynthesis
MFGGGRWTRWKKYAQPWYLLRKQMAVRSEGIREDYYKSLRNFDVVVTVSNHTKYAIKSMFGDRKMPEIKVCYSPEKQRTLYGEVSDKRYILLTQCDRPLKNIHRALTAINNLQKHGLIPDIKTKITGRPSLQMKEEFGNNPMMEFYDRYIPTEELEKLYAECTLFMFPTLNEGFGYPPLEAMSYGKTCVVGADTSLFEVGGDAVYYANPYDEFEIQTRIMQAIENPKDPDYVKARCEKINQKQRKDLEDLCELIVNI